mgnify:CR=1 FL=1
MHWTKVVQNAIPYKCYLINFCPKINNKRVIADFMICAPPQPPLPPKIKKCHIAYDLPLAEYGMCSKFGSNRSKIVDFYKEHTHKHTFRFIYKIIYFLKMYRSINFSTDPIRYRSLTFDFRYRYRSDTNLIQILY